MLKKETLAGKTAVIIGGTSGIGLAIAQAYVQKGATVVPVSRSQAKGTKAIKELAPYGTVCKRAYTVDVAKERSVQRLVTNVSKVYRAIDIVVCTAGCHLKKDFLKMTTPEWRTVLETNLTGTYLVNKYFGAKMCKKKKGSIINISSLGAHVALSKATAYCVSKAGVSMLTKSLAYEWAQTGVRVNAIVPGVFLTPLNKKALSDPVRKKNIITKTPMKRLGKLKEITAAAVFLASDEASFVTGTEITVDGGFLASSGF